MGDDVAATVADDGRESLRAFGRWLRTATAIDEQVQEATNRLLRTAAIPWPSAEAIDPDHTQRDLALETGDWTRYGTEIAGIGHLFAEAGAGVGGWFSVLAIYHHAVARERALEPVLLDGVVRYTERILRIVGDAYTTRQRELMRAARDEVELYAEVVRQSPGPKVVYEWRRPPERTSFVLIAANPAARKLAPTILESMNLPISDQYPHFPRMELCDRMIETMETGAGTTCVVRPLSGGVFEARVFVIRPGVVGVIYHDIGEAVRQQAEAAAHLAEAQEANRSLDAFAYVASHDLKAPLRDIGNLATWIAEDAADAMSEASRKHLAQLHDRTIRMDKLLDDLLAYSRAGRVKAVAEDVSVRTLVDDAVALAGPREGFEIRATGVELALRTPRTPLVQVLRNLVDNALKHHDRPAGTVSIEAAEADAAIRFTVVDDGPGIPAAFRERVFQPFTTLKPRDRVEGSGMGLAIVKKLIEAHGGRIDVEAAEPDGRGTRMTFVWPRARAQPGGAR